MTLPGYVTTSTGDVTRIIDDVPHGRCALWLGRCALLLDDMPEPEVSTGGVNGR